MARKLNEGLNCLSAGSVSLTIMGILEAFAGRFASQLPFGWVCFSNGDYVARIRLCWAAHVSIAFRLGLFL